MGDSEAAANRVRNPVSGSSCSSTENGMAGTAKEDDTGEHVNGMADPAFEEKEKETEKDGGACATAQGSPLSADEEGILEGGTQGALGEVAAIPKHQAVPSQTQDDLEEGAAIPNDEDVVEEFPTLKLPRVTHGPLEEVAAIPKDEDAVEEFPTLGLPSGTQDALQEVTDIPKDEEVLEECSAPVQTAPGNGSAHLSSSSLDGDKSETATATDLSFPDREEESVQEPCPPLALRWPPLPAPLGPETNAGAAPESELSADGAGKLCSDALEGFPQLQFQVPATDSRFGISHARLDLPTRSDGEGEETAADGLVFDSFPTAAAAVDDSNVHEDFPSQVPLVKSESGLSSAADPVLAADGRPDCTAPPDDVIASPPRRSGANDDDPAPAVLASRSDGLTLSSLPPRPPPDRAPELQLQPQPMARSYQSLGAMPPVVQNFQRSILAACPTADRLLQQALRRVLGIANP
jgi:hypothetical protein